MFSGIVEEKARVHSLRQEKDLSTLVLESHLDFSRRRIGDSVSIEGVCLTLVHQEPSETGGTLLSFELSHETMRRTTFSALAEAWAQGEREGGMVNLERSLALGDSLDGHFVFGHVDATIELLEIREDGESRRYLWELPKALETMVVSKGSISLAGVSLTVGEVEERSFSVYLIPHTLARTTLADRKCGERVNVEVDMLGRYVTRYLSCCAKGPREEASEETREEKNSGAE